MGYGAGEARLYPQFPPSSGNSQRTDNAIRRFIVRTTQFKVVSDFQYATIEL